MIACNLIYIFTAAMLLSIAYLILTIKKNIVLLYMLLELILLYINITMLLSAFIIKDIGGVIFSLIITAVSGIELGLCLSFIIYIFLKRSSLILSGFSNIKS